MDISVVIPLYNEAESLPELEAWIERVMKEHNFTYEIIFVNDGSTDNSWEVIEGFTAKRIRGIRAIKFRRNYGKSPGLHCGFERAQGDVVITMDADLQDSPDEIPELYRMITEDGYDLVSGWKKTVRPVIQNDPDKAIQCHGPQILWHKQPARFQLRPEGLQKCRYQKYRSVQRYAPVYSIPGKDCRFP